VAWKHNCLHCSWVEQFDTYLLCESSGILK